MFRRFVGFVLGGALIVAIGLSFYWNPGSVTFHPTPSRSWELPLPLLMLLSFFAGGAVIFLLALVRETQWTWRDLRHRRHARKQARRSANLESARRLQWKGLSREAGALLGRWRDPSGRAEALTLARARLSAGEAERARDGLEALRGSHPGDPEVLEALAMAYGALGQIRSATASLEQAVAVDGQNPRLLRELRSAYAAEERWADAAEVEERHLDCLRRTGNLTPDDATLRQMRWRAALDEREDESAIAILADLHRQDPGDADVALALGDRYRSVGRERDAERTWLRACEAGGSPEVLDRLVASAAAEGDPGKISAAVHRALRGDPPARLRVRAARVLVDAGKLDEAGEILDAARDEPGAALVEAEIQRQRGMADLALRAIERAYVEAGRRRR